MGVIGGIGAKMLSKMGWTEGTGLGRNRDGVVNALVHKRRPQALGIGAEKQPFQDAWWDKILESAYGTPSKKVDDEALFEASDGRRCRPHGTAKLARIEAHDKATLAEGKQNGKGQENASESEKKQRRERRRKERELKKKSRELKIVEKGITKKRKKSKKDKVGTKAKIR